MLDPVLLRVNIIYVVILLVYFTTEFGVHYAIFNVRIMFIGDQGGLGP